MRETSICCFLYAPQPGTEPQPRYVPWLGIKPTTFWCREGCFKQLSHPARQRPIAFKLKSKLLTTPRKAPCHLDPACFSNDTVQPCPRCSPSCRCRVPSSSASAPSWDLPQGLFFALAVSLRLRFSHGWLLPVIQFSSQVSRPNPSLSQQHIFSIAIVTTQYFLFIYLMTISCSKPSV